MTWKVQQINTGTGEVTMKHANGVELNLTIPDDHKPHPHRANELLFKACAAHEKTKAFKQPKAIGGAHSFHYASLLWFATLIPTFVFLVWFFMRAMK